MIKTPKYALIMAAGRGLRMMPLTDSIPKAMAMLEGTTLIEKGILEVRKYIPEIFITVGYKGAMLAGHVIDLNVSGVFNTEGKGNAFWVYNTLMKFINEPVLLLTCDNVIELDIDFLMNNYSSLNEPACMVVPVKPIVGLDGDYIFHHNQVVYDLNRNKPSDYYCSGIQIINPYKVNQLTNPTEDFSLLWSQLIEKNQLTCAKPYPKKWFTVDTVENLNSMIKGGKND